MGLFRRSSREKQFDPQEEQRSIWDASFSFNGVQYPGMQQGVGMTPSHNLLGSNRPHIEGDLRSIVAAAQPNSIVSAAVLARALVLSEIQYEYEMYSSGDRKRHQHLDKFSRPKGTTMPRIHMELEMQASYSGTGFLWDDTRRKRLKVMRSDYVSILLGSNSTKEQVEKVEAKTRDLSADRRKEAIEWAMDAEILGYVYHVPGTDPIVIPEEHVMQWVPEPHPTSYWLGASWITSCVREIASDAQADVYADKFFQQGATPRLLHKMDPRWGPADVEKFKVIAEAESAGMFNSHKTMYVGGATDVQVVGTKLGDMGLTDFREMLESRIAVRSRVPPQILSIGSGQESGSMSGGNYDSARKQFADLWFVPYANGLAAAMEKIAPGPPKGFMSWNPKKIMLLQQDLLEAAEVVQANASAANTFITAGFYPDDVLKAVSSGNIKELIGKHSGRFSVQLLPVTEEDSGLDANQKPIANKSDGDKPELEKVAAAKPKELKSTEGADDA